MSRRRISDSIRRCGVKDNLSAPSKERKTICLTRSRRQYSRNGKISRRTFETAGGRIRKTLDTSRIAPAKVSGRVKSNSRGLMPDANRPADFAKSETAAAASTFSRAQILTISPPTLPVAPVIRILHIVEMFRNDALLNDLINFSLGGWAGFDNLAGKSKRIFCCSRPNEARFLSRAICRPPHQPDKN